MGCYINPPNESKEAFLEREGRIVSVEEAVINKTEVPVCYFSNGAWTAAAVCDCDDELERFTEEVGARLINWYMVDYIKVLEVSGYRVPESRPRLP